MVEEGHFGQCGPWRKKKGVKSTANKSKLEGEVVFLLFPLTCVDLWKLFFFLFPFSSPPLHFPSPHIVIVVPHTIRTLLTVRRRFVSFPPPPAARGAALLIQQKVLKLQAAKK